MFKHRVKRRIFQVYKTYTCSICKERMNSTKIVPYTKVCEECYKEHYFITEEEHQRIRAFQETLDKLII